jgi:hypothetical protein
MRPWKGIREMMVPTALAPGAVRPRLAIAEVVEQLSAAVPGGVSCFTLNIDGLWPEACAVHGTVQEDNVVLTGTVPARWKRSGSGGTQSWRPPSTMRT